MGGIHVPVEEDEVEAGLERAADLMDNGAVLEREIPPLLAVLLPEELLRTQGS